MQLFSCAANRFNMFAARRQTPESLKRRVKNIMSLATVMGVYTQEKPPVGDFANMTVYKRTYTSGILKVVEHNYDLSRPIQWSVFYGGVPVFSAEENSSQAGVYRSRPNASPAIGWRLALKAAHKDLIRQNKKAADFQSGYGHQ